MLVMVIMMGSLVAIRDSHLILDRRRTITPHTQRECNIVDSRDPHPRCLYEPRALLSLQEWVIEKIDEVEVKSRTLQ
jgi:hypothetical protein